ncbi:MAG: CBS domain-containing protein [Thermoplasmata archaeon]|nr:CBS domain-containing protein [Thermoplasmata archaeon]MCK5397738.1 CBS domain-containing protein [Thermoplasmata archaeon]
MKAEVPVLEIMSTDIPQLEPFESVENAAAKMVEHSSGCVIIVDEGKPIGIVTERDMVRKVLSERKNPAETQLRDVMSSPLVWIPRHIGIMEAAKQMASLKLRKLVVLHDGQFQGVVNARDILQIAPQMIEITRELADIGMPSGEYIADSIQQASGYCESCKGYSGMLEFMDGQLMCPTCKESLE